MYGNEKELINIKAASYWASEYLGKNVTSSNIAYLVQYGRIRKYGENGTTLVSRSEDVRNELKRITFSLKAFLLDAKTLDFESELISEL